MEKRDAIILLALLGGGAYAAWTNWDTIAARLGLDDLQPGRIKAIQLAKNAYDFERSSTNWQYLETRAQLGEIELSDKAWSAEPHSRDRFEVLVHWREAGKAVAQRFTVDIVTNTVVLAGPVEPAAPR